MATFYTSEYNKGLVQSGSMVRLIKPYVRAEGNGVGKFTPINNGDILAVGNTPAGTHTTKIRLLVKDAFPVGTTLDIGSINEGGALVPFATGIMVETAEVQMAIPLPLSGVVIWNTGLAETDVQNGGYWGATKLGVKVNGAGIDGVNLLGSAILVLDYSYYKSGSETDTDAFSYEGGDLGV